MARRKRKCLLFVTFSLIVVLFLISMWRSYVLLQSRGGEGDKTRKYVVRENELTENIDNNMQIENTRAKTAIKAVAGVSPSELEYYIPDSRGMFTCRDGGQQIGIISVNDDYCDCHDGSDEPGTDACPNSRFYCSPQRVYLPSSRVNDGICDCCDGSDEWKQLQAGEHILYYSPREHYSPCKDFCST